MKVIISNQSKIGNPSEVRVTNNNNVGRVTFGKVVRTDTYIGQALDLDKNGSIDGSVITYDANTDSFILLPTEQGISLDAYAQANAAYAQANVALSIASNVSVASNTANLAYAQANAAYAQANTKLSTSGGTVTGSLVIQGDLTVSGNTTVIDVETLNVSDPMIHLASDNLSDLIDIGFVGSKVNAGVPNHTGLVRHSVDKKYYLFDSYTGNVSTNVIDVSGLSLSTLRANIEANSITLNGNSVATQTEVNNKVSKSGDTMTGTLILTAPDTGLQVTNNITIGVAGSIGVGIAIPRANLDVTGNAVITQGLTTSNLTATSANISGNVVIGKVLAMDDICETYANSFSITTNATTAVDRFPANRFGTMKYVIQMTRVDGIHSTEILLIQNGLTAYATEYATLVTGPILGYFSLDISAGEVVLEFEPDNPLNEIINFKLVRQGIRI